MSLTTPSGTPTPDASSPRRQENLNHLRWLPVTVSVLLMVAIALFSAVSFRNLKNASKWRKHSVDIILAAQTYQDNFTDIVRGMRGYVTLGDTNALASYEAGLAQEPQLFKQLVDNTRDNPAQEQRLQGLAKAVQDARAYFERMLALYHQEGTPAIFRSDATGESRVVYGRERAILKSFSQEEQNLLDARAVAEQASYRNTARLVAVGCGLAAALLLLANWIAGRELASRRRAENKFKALLEFAPDAIIITTRTGEMTLLNSRVERLFGYPRRELLGKKIELLIPPACRHQYTARLEDYFASPSDRPMDAGIKLFGLRKDGSEFPSEISLSPLDTDEGTLAIAVIRDVTERKMVEARLNEQAAELRRSNEELEQFAYVASHDMREPLRAISGFAQILKKDAHERLTPQDNRLIEHVVEGARRMSDIIDDLLALSRIGSHSTAFTLLALDKPLHRAAENLSVTIRERQAIIRNEPLPMLQIDGSLLALLFQNLIGNAIKFCKDRAPEIDIGAAKSADGCWTISVRDNGIGIDPKYFDRIFGIFQRLHTRAEYAGTGIGLAICKKIVDCHGGNIWLESVPGQGTTFFFSLPEKQNKR